MSKTPCPYCQADITGLEVCWNCGKTGKKMNCIYCGAMTTINNFPACAEHLPLHIIVRELGRINFTLAGIRKDQRFMNGVGRDQ